MTAQSDNRPLAQIGNGAIPERTGPIGVGSGKILFSGALILITAAGFAIPGTSTGAAGLVAGGVSTKKVDNSTGGDGDLKCELARGTFPFANSSSTDAITIADIGRPCYVVDDQTVARTSNGGKRALAGIVEGLDEDGFVLVRVGGESAGRDDIMRLAAADLRTKTGFFVKIDSDGKAALAGAGEFAAGVLVNAPNTGEIAIIRHSGLVHVVTAATPAAGSLVASDSAGKAVAATLAKVNTSDAGAAADPVIASNVIATLLEAGVADTLTAALITRAGAVPTTAA